MNVVIQEIYRDQKIATPGEMKFHLGHNVNWTVLRKTVPDNASAAWPRQQITKSSA